MLRGDVNTAQYSLRDISGTLLASGNLPRTWADLSWYGVLLTIPATKFRVTVTTVGLDGKTNSWTTKIYSPETFSVVLESNAGVFAFGQTIDAKIIGKSTGASGDYVISLDRPSDFPGEIGPWAVTVVPGGTVVIPFQMLAPPSGISNSTYTMRINYAAKASPQDSGFSNQVFMGQ